MAWAGSSYSGSGHHKSGITTRFRCTVCGRDYKQIDPKNIHQIQCLERKKRMDKEEKKDLEKKERMDKEEAEK